MRKSIEDSETGCLTDYPMETNNYKSVNKKKSFNFMH